MQHANNLTDGFVATIYRKPGRAFEVVTRQSKSGRLSANKSAKSAPSHYFEQVFCPGGRETKTALYNEAREKKAMTEPTLEFSCA